MVRCSFRVGAKGGTFFEKAHLPLDKIFKFVSYWLALKRKQKWLEYELDIASDTVVNRSNFCREVCLICLVDNSEKLGGNGVIVEIDECKMCKRKYNKGRIIEGQWIFGGIERESKKLFLVPVEERSKESLLAVIKEYILPGTTIVSDCWKSYNCLADEGFQHQTVNHSQNFVDPDTGAHTQNIERAWRDVRGDVPKFGRKKEHFSGYLAEHLFRRKYPNHKDMYHIFFKYMGQVYPPTSNIEGDE